MPFGQLGALTLGLGARGSPAYAVPPDLAGAKYFLSGNWSSANSWATTSGGTAGAGAPSAAEYAIFDGNSGSGTINSAATARSVICADAYVGALTHSAAVTLTIGDATSGYQDRALRFSRGMTYTLSNVATSALSFISTSTTQQAIDLGGKSAGNITINSASNGNYAFTSAINMDATATITHSAGALHFDGASDAAGLTHNIGKFSGPASTVRVLNCGYATFYILGTGIAWTMSSTANITFTGANATFISAANIGDATQQVQLVFGVAVSTPKTVAAVKLYGPAEKTISGLGTGATLTVGTLERIGPMTAASSLSSGSLLLGISAGGIVKVTNLLKVHGDSAINRVQVWPTANAIPGTLDVAGATLDLEYVNFQDITFKNGGANLDLSAITGGSGDAGGNTISGGGTLTLTAPTTQTWQTTGAGNFSDVTKWTSRIPLPQDIVVLDAAFSGSPTISLDMAWTGKVSFAGGSGNVTLDAVPRNGANVVGGFTGRAGVALTASNAVATFYWNARASGVVVDMAGASNTSTNVVSSANGGDITFKTATLSGNLTVRAGILIVESGQTLTAGGYTSAANNTSAAADLRISGTLALSATGTVVSVGTVGAGINICGEYGGKIQITDTSATVKTFAGNGNTFTTLQTPAGAGGVTITGANTFTGSGIQAPAGGKVTLPGSTTTTLNAAASAAVFGNGTSQLTMVPSAGSATLSFGAAATPNYLTLTNIIAAGAGSPVHAGANSVDNGGNTSWIFP